MTATAKRVRWNGRDYITLEIHRGRELLLSAQWRVESFEQRHLMRALELATQGEAP